MPWLRKKGYTDAEILVALYQDGSVRAEVLEWMYGRYQKMILKMVMEEGGTEEQAIGVLHEGFIRLEGSVRKGTFRGESKVSTYFFTICRNHWRRIQQKDRRFRTEDAQHVQIEDQTETMIDLLQQEETQRKIQSILVHIDKRCRELLLWTDGEGQSMGEVAQRLKFNSVQAARNQKTRCRKRLRDMIHSTPSYKALVIELLEHVEIEDIV